MSFDPDAYLSGADQPFDPDAHLTDAPKSEDKPSKLHKAITDASTYMLGAAGPAIAEQVSGLGANVAAGAKTVFDWATGKVKSVGEADDAAQQFIREHTYTPDKGTDAARVSEALSSPINPLNWFGAASNAIASDVSYMTNRPGGYQMPDAVRAAGDFAGPLLGGAADVGVGMMGAKGKPKAPPAEAPRVPASEAPTTPMPPPPEPRLADAHLSLADTPPRTLPTETPAAAPGSSAPLTATSIPRSPSWEARDPAAPKALVDSEPARGGLALTDPQREQRAQILARVGQQTARESALSGDAGNAGTDYQMTKFNQEPAGVAAAEQFAHEKQALTTHAESIVHDTGGTLGTGEDALNARGETIDAPFSALRDWFKKQSKNDYDTVKAQFGDKPVGPLSDTEALLKDPDFTESLLAKNQGHFLESAARQYERIKALNPDGFTVQNAEHFRKFLNSVWTPETSAAIGRMTDAIDGDVTRAAGSDVYESARARVRLKHQLLDDPDGVSKLFDTDPRTPINRTTSLDKIPDVLTRLPPAQFENVLTTLKNMPDELQPQARAAMAEIKAHLANKLLDAGTNTQGQWNSLGVTKVLKGNSAKFRMAFGDDPATVEKIRDLDSAGRINRTDQSYPGAAAQAANAVKRGMMSHLITRGATSAGAMTGGAVGSIAGAAGAAAGSAVGAAVGEGLGSRATQGMAERAALKGWQGRVRTLSELASK